MQTPQLQLGLKEALEGNFDKYTYIEEYLND